MTAINLEDKALPKQWAITKLPDFANVVMGQSPSSETYNLDGKGLPFFQGKGEFGTIYPTINKYCSIPNKIAEEGATLLSVRAPVGPTNLAKTRCCIGRGLAAIHPVGGVDPKFILMLFRSIEVNLSGEGTGSTFKAITKAFVDQLTFAVPPLNEQKRIVAKIEELFSELDNGIATLKAAREQLKVYRQAVLKHAFEGKLTAKWREENSDKLKTTEELCFHVQQERENCYQQQLDECNTAIKIWVTNGKLGKKPVSPKRLKTFGPFLDAEMIELSELPNGWYWGKLGDITTGVEYGTSAKSSKSGLIPVIRMGNLQNGKIDWSDLVYTSDEEEIEKYELKLNDVLFNRTNSPELVGKTAKYRGEQPAIFAGYLIRVNQIDSIVLSDYLNYFLNSHIAKQYGNSVKTDGVNQSNINGEKLQHYPFPFCTIAEQAKIIEIVEEKVSQTESCIHDIEFQLTKAEILRQSILKKAFSGKLVPQYPSDEPASELLARIKHAKAEQVTSKNTYKKQTKQRYQP